MQPFQNTPKPCANGVGRPKVPSYQMINPAAAWPYEKSFMFQKCIGNERRFILAGSDGQPLIEKPWSPVMTKLLATAALATLIAMPAMAQSPSKPHLNKHITNAQAQAAPFGRSE